MVVACTTLIMFTLTELSSPNCCAMRGTSFAASIKKFSELNDKTEGGCVIYSGENSQKIGDIQLVNFSETSKVIR